MLFLIQRYCKHTALVHKRQKSNAVAELLQKETNAHFVNLFTNKIDLKMLVKHLHKKMNLKTTDQKFIYFILVVTYNQLLITTNSHSCGDTKIVRFILHQKSSGKERLKLVLLLQVIFEAGSLSQNNDICRGFYCVS